MYAASRGDDKLIIFSLDEKSGTLTLVSEMSLPRGPAPIAFHPSKAVLYIGLRESRELAAFRINPSGELSPLRAVLLESDPTYLSLDRKANFIFSAYFLAGAVAVHALSEDGTVRHPPIEWIKTGTGAHSIQADRSNRFVFAPHVAGPDRPDAIFQYRFDGHTGRLTPNAPARVSAEKGAGPRHLYWHPSKDILYCTNEQEASVSAFSFDSAVGLLTPLQTVAAAPQGQPGWHMCAGIQVLPSGSFLYASVRGYDGGYNGIACFAIDQVTGLLSLKERVDSEPIPHGLSRDRYGKFLFVTCQETGRLVVYRIDEKTGGLERLASYPIGRNPLWAVASP